MFVYPQNFYYLCSRNLKYYSYGKDYIDETLSSDRDAACL